MTSFTPQRRRSQFGERGAAAVEMAIVLPWLLLIIWLMIDMSLMLLSRQEMTRLAQSAARICVAQQPPPDSATNDVKNCVNVMLIKYWATAGLGRLCTNPNPTIATNKASVSYGTQPLIWTVDITLKCDYKPITPMLANVVPPVQGHAAMPFLGSQ